MKKIPFASRVYKIFITPVRGHASRKALVQLGSIPCSKGPQIADALKFLRQKLPQSDQEWTDRIEVERKRLLTDKKPLNDGSLGEGGLYDNGITVEQACLVSKPPEPALMLFMLTRALKPVNVIELGTNVGISSAYIGAALKLNGQNGRIITLDASPYRQHLAREIHSNIGIDNVSYVEGLFSDTLHQSLLQLGSVDLAFIDGHHQHKPTLAYFEEIFKSSAPDGVFVFDDIRWSDGMKQAWSQIRSDHRLGVIVDLLSVGIGTRRSEDNPQRFLFGPIYAF